ncbi:competence type IV pilus ATPase ComGA [Ornithinibacillus sp. 4-3]|uniref:Competence type IV pilus ATPase ComGA n=1 Tax=Ornithinibacillus sp. 4-3 TaxID=3231488 RepID=A0AB39HIZ7_9BACI
MSVAAKISEKILTNAYKLQATDIHFYPYTKQTDIYFRIHGVRTMYKTITASQYRILLAYYKFASGMDIGQIRNPQNGKITHYTSSGRYDLRLSTLPVHQMESLAIRILPKEDYYALEHLFLFPKQLQQLKECISNKAGIFLMTGPTGSGKTTTMYALLEALLAEKSYQMITLEDPIEKNMNHILQVQVNEKAGVTYQAGLKAALRHDPDVLMIGEIRDKEIAKFAFEAALTGHLVLSTLHAKNAIGTIYRLVEMGIKYSEIQQTLIAIAALELIPIHYKGAFQRRAAIMELLTENTIEKVLNKGVKNVQPDYQTFRDLRKKAYAYGYTLENQCDIP